MSRNPEEPRKRPRPKPVESPAFDLDPDEGELESRPPSRTEQETSTFRPSVSRPVAPRKTQSSAERPSPGKQGGRSSREREPLPVRGGPNWLERIIFGKVSSGHLSTFCRQFGAYLDAGVDLLRSLSSLEKQFAGTALGQVIGRVHVAVRRGETLSDAFTREPQAFDAYFLSMIRVAEARGGVPETLRGMADHFEARQRLVRQARSALIYPLSVLVIASAVVLFLTIFVLPVLVGLLEDMSRNKAVSLPAPTLLLIAISNFMQKIGWWLIPSAVVAGFFALRFAYKRPAGKAAIDEVCLYVPVLGKLLVKIDVTRFARTLSSLLGAGVDVGKSLDLTADVLHLSPFRRAVRASKTVVMEGAELSGALDDSRRFPHDVIAIINSGEETGKLPESLHKLADDYEEQVSYMVKNLGSLIQPLILLFMGGIVGFIVLAFFMAYISIISNLAGS